MIQLSNGDLPKGHEHQHRSSKARVRIQSLQISFDPCYSFNCRFSSPTLMATAMWMVEIFWRGNVSSVKQAIHLPTEMVTESSTLQTLLFGKQVILPSRLQRT